jgi:ATP-dependent RNA helicase RhlE
MKFEQYPIIEGVKKSIAKLGYKTPTDIQYKSIPAILRGEDVLAIAQTGTGKTAAFAIPVIHQLHIRKEKRRPDGVKCLVMTPTHELALQTHTVFQTLAAHTNVKTSCIHGGVDQLPQKEALEKGVDVLIATPGRLFDLISQGVLSLHRLEILVLDEADHMLDLGFIRDIRALMKHLPKRRQTLFFSATIDDDIKKIAYSLVINPIRIQLSPKDPVAKNIEHAVGFIEMDDKRHFLADFIHRHKNQKILVFVRTKVRAERVKKALEKMELNAETLHSDKLQMEREATMKNFKTGACSILIATDISARGIDIPNVEFVINYDLPESPEHYVHRVGRTGRGKQKGEAISFCSSEEKPRLEVIEKSLGKPIRRLSISKGDYRFTVEQTIEKENDWQTLMLEAEKNDKKRSKKKR